MHGYVYGQNLPQHPLDSLDHNRLPFVTKLEPCLLVLVYDTLYPGTANWQNKTLAQLKLKQK